MGNRTEELRGQGARRVGSDGSAPFVQWGSEYAWVEGQIVDMWEGEYGRVARMRVTNRSTNLDCRMDKESPLEPVAIGSTVNVGLNYSSLRDIDETFSGKRMHIAFTGWEKTKKNQDFRAFTVLVMADPEPREEPPARGGTYDPADEISDDQIPF